MTVDVFQWGEALAIFERDLITHFQQISRAAALYIRALLGGVKRALEIYRRVDETTKNYPWFTPTTEEKWHAHAEGVLTVALTTLNLPIEAWKSARLLRAVPNCRLVLMLSCHMLSPALSVEETGLMSYLQAPPEAGPTITQVTSGLQNWKCAGRRLVEIGETTDCYAAAPVVYQDSRQASSRKQEGEFCFSAEVKHHPHDESESNRDCGPFLIC